MPSNDLPTPGSLVLLSKNGNDLIDSTTAQIRLSPTPSDDVNDPLNWSSSRKQLSHLCLVLYTLCSGIACTLVYSILVPIEEDTGIPLSTLNAATGYFFLLLGWGGLVTQPLALMFGKRGMYLVSMLGSIGCLIWNVHVKSSGDWIANKVIHGLFLSPIEMLVETSISDVFFAHERGLYIGIYGLVLFGSNFIAPLIAGFMYQSHGYKFVFYMGILIQGVALVFCFFFMEETNYNRNTTELSEVHDEDIKSPYQSNFETNINDFNKTDNGDSTSEENKEINHQEKPQINVEVLNQFNQEKTPFQGEPTTFYKKMTMFNKKYADLSQLLVLVYRPFLLLQFPVIFWAGFQYGICVMWYSVMNATASLILSAEPYNFKASFVGLAYLGPIVGISIASIYTGWFGNKVLVWRTKQSGGVREPEERLWLILVCVLLVPASLILWGVGAAHQIHWIGLIFGMGMSSCSTGIGAVVSINYALDSYKDLSGEVMLSMILVRNTITFAIGYIITPWLKLGLQNTFISAAFVGLAFDLTSVIMLIFGKRFRHFSRKTYWKYVENSASSSH